MAADIICRLLAAPDAASPISSYLVPLSSVWLNILRDCDTHFSLTAPHFVTADLATLPAAEEEMKTGRVSPAEAEVLGWDGTLAEDVLSKQDIYYKTLC